MLTVIDDLRLVVGASESCDADVVVTMTTSSNASFETSSVAFSHAAWKILQTIDQSQRRSPSRKSSLIGKNAVEGFGEK